jgi:hypothetical protein
MLEAAQTVSDVEKEVSEEVPGGNLEAAEDLGNVKLLPER